MKWPLTGTFKKHVRPIKVFNPAEIMMIVSLKS